MVTSMQHKQDPELSHFALDQLHTGELQAAPSLEGFLQTPLGEERMREREEGFGLLRGRPGFEALLEKEFERHQRLKLTRNEAAFGSAPSATPKPEGGQPRWWFAWSWGALSAAALGCLIFLSLPPKPQLDPGWGIPTDRAPLQAQLQKHKGSHLGTSELMFRALAFRKGDPYPKWLRNGHQLRPGALVQFSYMATRAKHVMIVGMNKKGETYAFVPYLGKSSTRIPAGQGKLPRDATSLELDDYIGPERFFFFVADKPFAYTQAQRALKQAFHRAQRKVKAMGQIPGPWEVRTLLIQKRKH